MFLEFDSVNMSKSTAKYTILHENIDEGRLVHVKDTAHQLRMICRRLARKEEIFYFWPLSVGGECDEKIESVIVASEGDGILESLIHVSRATSVRQREDNAITNIMEINVTAGMGAYTRLVALIEELRRWHPRVPLSSKLHALQIP